MWIVFYVIVCIPFTTQYLGICFQIYNSFPNESISHQQQCSTRILFSPFLIRFSFIRIPCKCNAVFSKHTGGKLKDKYNRGIYGNKKREAEEIWSYHNEENDHYFHISLCGYIYVCIKFNYFKKKKKKDKLDNLVSQLHSTMSLRTVNICNGFFHSAVITKGKAHQRFTHPDVVMWSTLSISRISQSKTEWSAANLFTVQILKVT